LTVSRFSVQTFSQTAGSAWSLSDAAERGSSGVVVLGLRDVQQKMLSLPRRMGTNVVRRGLLAGAGVVRDQARINAPQPPAKSAKGSPRSGLLRKKIASETRGVFRDGKGIPVEHRAVVHIQKRKAGEPSARVYDAPVEKGSRPHAVGKGSILTVWKGSKRVANQHGAMHPGTAAQPFMKPAFETKKFEAIKVIEAKTREELDKEIRKIAAAKGGAA
jgi:hypothetical protein